MFLKNRKPLFTNNMKKTSILYLFTILVFLYSNNSLFATTCSSIASGNWNAGTTWSCGAKPNCGDTVYINHKVTVTVTEDYRACATPIQIVITGTGTLHFDDGKKLRLPCNSGVVINSGGKITTNSYNGNSEELEMGGGSGPCSSTTLWQSSNGELNGPTVLGSGLPIELISFEVNWLNRIANITWRTASETNNDYFVLEKSLSGLDFEFLSLVEGAGTSNTIRHYSDLDDYPYQNGTYYRLKQTDYDGNYSYSPIIYLSPVNASTELFVYPNPNDGIFNVLVNGFEENTLQLKILDITGRILYSQQILSLSETHTEKITLPEEIPFGTYFISIESKDVSLKELLIIR